jgi:phage shock protein PspC (stress-responsive transcriptional regulator)
MEDQARDRARNLREEWHRGYPERKIAGVCSAIAAHFDIPLTAVRVGFVVAALPSFSFFGALVYAAAWFLTPDEPGEPSAFDQGVDFCEDIIAGIRGEGSKGRDDYETVDLDRD